MYAIYLFISLYIYPVRSLCIFDTARYRCSQDMKDKHSKVALFGSKAPLENRCRPVGGWGGWIPLMSFLVEIYRIRSKHMIKYQQKESLKKERPILQFIDFILTQQWGWSQCNPGLLLCLCLSWEEIVMVLFVWENVLTYIWMYDVLWCIGILYR